MNFNSEGGILSQKLARWAVELFLTGCYSLPPHALKKYKIFTSQTVF